MHEIRLYGELHRFVPVLAAAKGFRVARSRRRSIGRGKYGKSKYGVSRLTKGLARSADREIPRSATASGRSTCWARSGLLAFLLGGLGMVYLAVRVVLSRVIDGWTPVHLHETAALYYSLGAVHHRRPVLVGRLPGRDDRRLPGPRRRHLFDRRAHRRPARAAAATRRLGQDRARRHDGRRARRIRSPALRWGVYLVLIAVAVGNMTGRLLAVNSVDKVQLEAARISERLDSERKQVDRRRASPASNSKPAWRSRKRDSATSCSCSGRFSVRTIAAAG